MRGLPQRGAALLIIVMLIIAVAAIAVTVAGSMAGGDISDSAVQGKSVDALYTAESGIERALKQFSSGTACAALGTVGDIPVFTSRIFNTTAKGSTDFDGATLLPNSKCRVEVSGTVAGSGIPRKLQAVLDRNLLAGENPGFNNPVGGAGQWATTGRWDTTGGPDPVGSAPTSCTRAMYVVKPRQAAGVISSGTATIIVSPAATATTGNVAVRFNYRATEVTSTTSTACATDALAAACPTGGANPAANDVMICFSLDGGTTFRTFATAASTASIGPAVTGPACNPTTVSNPTAYASCASRYQQGTAIAKAQVLVPAPGTISSIQVKIYLRAAGPAREVWVDNIELINDAGLGIARADWRDCTVVDCV
jgi:hypothetical protein